MFLYLQPSIIYIICKKYNNNVKVIKLILYIAIMNKQPVLNS